MCVCVFVCLSFSVQGYQALPVFNSLPISAAPATFLLEAERSRWERGGGSMDRIENIYINKICHLPGAFIQSDLNYNECIGYILVCVTQ